MSANPFPDMPASPATHFRLTFHAAVAWLMAAAGARTGHQPLEERFPFLDGYRASLCRPETARFDAGQTARWWRHAVIAWEASCHVFLPMRALRAAASLDHDAMRLLLAIGLVEEDARFGLVFEALDCLQSRRPTAGVLADLWESECEREVRPLVAELRRLGLIQVANPDAPRAEWALHVPAPIWDALRGDACQHTAGWALHQSPEDLAGLQDLIVADSLHAPLSAIPALLGAGTCRALVLRGPRHNGRHAALRAVARALGLGTLEIHGIVKPDDDRWRIAGLLAVAYHAMPVVALDQGPGETVELPSLGCYDGPIGVVLGRQGGVTGPAVERAVTIALDIPDPVRRRAIWRRCLPADRLADLDAIGDRFRLTSGNIVRAARLAQSHAALAGRPGVGADDVRQASRSLNREALDALAAWLPAAGDWAHLAAREETLRELAELELRCRHRERLGAMAPMTAVPAASSGVRALFRGPSGTGKTLAARLLASVLDLDLYRLDLSALVNKYIGETEKNLDRALSRAEELGVILLLDEGDALLTQRTSVQSSNDRYANLETNYLLQRLESFDGILLVTTNAGDRIDAAFERRMDVVIDFRPPDVAERWDIWHLHLPATHRVDPDVLNEIATRCVLGGGQIRNAALHAALLAIDGGTEVATEHLEAAVRREYRKAGGVCPLRRADPAWAARG